ncbi:protein serine/threonine phosphatase 2C [Dichomitus squalens]|uniref:Protein phosphatase n=1 Tax=Dichomitus squalens TaxID=114155 RepID=A0A4Q9N9K9_9APHY|nr:protein serine/threonine phosphatase 2C [Dichomitus squalens LYAD-421 SS1]EJF65839.1 protein serine/threonine phosphatase 2C [Dichomitus squalens LYAD-421 SS1]TBU36001.1 protein serine/threonine phosphatase 2C [Dichomitus squalens]TBU50756.1 protein serine/threonine phosphatase 2C [Dichomitus squalens]TBU65849.1 protein serine/threonine phosphatase 2C [Dichomitus squalens]
MVLPFISKHPLLCKIPRTLPKCIPGIALSKQARCFASSTPSSSPPLPRPYRFHVGASWAGKPHDPRGPRVNTDPFPPDSPIGKWRDTTLSRPNPGAGKHIGEDFFYIQDMREGSGVSLGVADGVGGWVESGIDPSLFSQALMYHAHRYSKVAWPGEPEVDPMQEYEEREQVEGWELSPVECLESAYGGVLRERYVVAGSSTACILTLNASTGMLRAANLGDSGFLIIRGSQVIYQQRSQTHFFNCPKQLSKLPVAQKRFSRAVVDHPKDADLCELKLRHGDLIIAYTDGLSDNVFPSEMVAICGLVARQFQLNRRTITPVGEMEFEGSAEDQEVQAMAERIVDYARICMANTKRVSPFERAAAREGMYFRGGKVDDVTVLVTMVQEAI